jgi:hypothetical protein
VASRSVLACFHLLSARTLLLAPLQDLLFTAGWDNCCGSSVKKLELPFLSCFDSGKGSELA